MPKTVGIIGGAFDPIHRSHLLLGERALKYVDEVWFQPCYSHMFAKNMSAPNHRLKMCDLAIQELFPGCVARKKMKVSDFEIKYELDLCTYDILHQLETFDGQIQFQLIVGQDNADGIEKWKHSEELRREFSFVVFPRLAKSEWLEPTDYAPKWYHEEPHLFANQDVIPDMSSTELRAKLAWNFHKPWPDSHVINLLKYTPRSVVDYIQANDLYKGQSDV